MPYPELDAYQLNDPDSILSPGLMIFKPLLEHNLDEMIRIAGGPDRLCPHCKTHKMPAIIDLLLKRGVTHHKCATLGEAEMLARAGVPEILIAYPLVGPNPGRLARLVKAWPQVRFATLVDSPAALEPLSRAITNGAPGQSIDILLDLNPGMHRTGIAPSPEAIELYEMIDSTAGLQAGGLHWYDGHHRQPDRQQRTTAVRFGWDQLTRFRNQLMMTGLPIPRVVAAGTGSFPILAEVGEPDLQLSPGTTTLFDDDMATRFPELNLFPAQAILTRVISRPSAETVTLDVGHKACAADQPAGSRLAFPELDSWQEVMHSEEHLVLATPEASRFRLGDPLIAIARHACPVSAMYPEATVVENGQVVDRWPITARDRTTSLDAGS